MSFVADPQQRVENWQLDSSTARANLLTNGGFEIWQRGAGTFSGNATFTADRWAIGLGAGSTLPVARSTAALAPGSQFSLNATYTHGAVSGISQKLEGVMFAGRTITLSMVVWCNAANAVRLRIDNDSSGGGTPGAFHTGNSGFQTLTVTQAIPSNATVVYVNAELDASCIFYLDNAMLVVGSVPADYAPMHPADDMARCLRYYEVSTGNWQGSGYCSAATSAEFLFRYQFPKGGSPSLTLVPASAFSVRSGAGVLTAGTSIAPNNTLLDTTELTLNVASGLTLGQGALLYTNTSAAIRAEWNP